MVNFKPGNIWKTIFFVSDTGDSEEKLRTTCVIVRTAFLKIMILHRKRRFQSYPIRNPIRSDPESDPGFVNCHLNNNIEHHLKTTLNTTWKQQWTPLENNIEHHLKTTLNTTWKQHWTPLENKPHYLLGLCYVCYVQYRLLSTNYTRNLVSKPRTNCPKSLSTLQRITQQKTATYCLFFTVQPIYWHNPISADVFTANHITRLPTASLLTNQIAHQGFWVFNWLKSLDSEDGFRTGCWNVSRQQQSFSGLQLPRWSFQSW